jgi:hypothetical protein
MLGETEEYEPLSRAAYYHAMRKMQRKNKSLSQPTRRRGAGAELKYIGLKKQTLSNFIILEGFSFF